MNELSGESQQVSLAKVRRQRTWREFCEMKDGN